MTVGNLANVTSDSYTISGLSGDIYVVAHATVVGFPVEKAKTDLDLPRYTPPAISAGGVFYLTDGKTPHLSFPSTISGEPGARVVQEVGYLVFLTQCGRILACLSRPKFI